jgi:hypothetical protein
MVTLWIPLMKDLGLSYTEVKESSRTELLGLLKGLSNYNTVHAFDGYTSDDISELAKKNPSIRGDYASTQAMKAKYGFGKKQPQSFKELIK